MNQMSSTVQESLAKYDPANIFKIFYQKDPQWLEDHVLDMYRFIKDSNVDKDIVYFYLLISEPQIFKNFIEYSKNSFEFDVNDTLTYIDYMIFYDSHWAYQLFEQKDCFYANKKISKIRCVNFFKNTSLILNIENSKKILQEINLLELDEFWRYYIKETSCIIRLIEFCKFKNPDIDEKELFLVGSKKSTLEIFSDFIELQTVCYEEIAPQLHQSEQEIYLQFIILKKIIQLIKNDFAEDINVLFDDILNKILSISKIDTKVELLENVFACLFIKEDKRFWCKEKDIRGILYILKSVIKEIEECKRKKSLYGTNEQLYSLKKVVADAQWRLELVAKLGDKEKYQNDFLKYMLAAPESLIYLCLKNKQFLEACQVLKIFNIEKTHVGKELGFILKFQDLKTNIKNKFKNKSIQSLRVPDIDKKLHNEFVNFFHVETDPKEIFRIIFDLLICDLNWEDSFDLVQSIIKYNFKDNEDNSGYKKFVTSIIEFFIEVGFDIKLNVPELLLEPNIPLDLTRYKEIERLYKNLEEFYDEFVRNLNTKESGVLDPIHASHKTFFKLNMICCEFNENINLNTTKYLQKLFNYLKAFSRILYLEDDHSAIVSQGISTSYFNLLEKNRADLVGKLLFQKHLNPSEFEKYFGKLKLDFLYHVTGNCFPTINLYYHQEVGENELYPENKLHIPNKDIIEYIQKRNWFLAFLLKEMYFVTDAKMEINEWRISTFLNYLKLSRIQHLKIAFENNSILTAVQNNNFGFYKELDYIKSQICNFDIISSVASSPSGNSSSTEYGEELQEEDFSILDTYSLCNIFESALENHLKNVLDLRDKVILKTFQEHSFEPKAFSLIQLIQNPTRRVDLILENVGKWPMDISLTCIKYEITRFSTSCDNEKINEMKMRLRQIVHYKQIIPLFKLNLWSEIILLIEKHPGSMVQKFIVDKNICLLIEFISLHSVDQKILEANITKDFIQDLLNVEIDYEKIKNLLNLIHKDLAVNICHAVIEDCKNLRQLEFLVYDLKHLFEYKDIVDIHISLKILNLIPENEFDNQFFNLLWNPLNILEVMIMNTKLESAKLILEKIKPELCDYDNTISIRRIDELVRRYAEKSLDFRIVTQPIQKKLSASKCTLMQSMDSLIEDSINSKRFAMPEAIPAKEEWVPDNQVTECMCCSNVTFSMFNRRHHCRRCGRVVCYACVQKRLLVPSYGDVPVKVCTECYSQSLANTDLDESVSIRTLVNDIWMLTNDEEHNIIVREEFFYEHTPSVYLCLSIMQLHSNSTEYCRFLLKHCESMLDLLNSKEETALQEVDYLLVVKMLKHLAVAIKMSAQECHLETELSLSNKFIAQADLLSLLANRGCLVLLSVSQESRFIDKAVLRKLRDRLLEREQWILALEVSTKAGLETTGVFVAWGKSCLKAGSLLFAREQFSKCLEKPRDRRESVSELDSSVDSTMSKKRSSSHCENPRSNKNPPLLDDIIKILESKREFIDKHVLEFFSSDKKQSVFSHPDDPIYVLSKLKNLQNIADGKYEVEILPERSKALNKPVLDDINYDECIYYLSNYGTALSTAEFHIKHGYFDKALNYIIQANLGPEVFAEIYMRCLKDGVVEILQREMSRMDSSFRLWKDYITHLCFYLEKQRMLNCLYQLQLFMGDYMRAAVSCIRFYKDGSSCFTDYYKKKNFLNKAKQHLMQVLEQEQWVDVTTESGGKIEEQSIVNPDLVMKIEIKDVYKHLKTIEVQAALVDFLVQCEALEGHKCPMEYLEEMIYPNETIKPKKIPVPTLFGPSTERRYLAVLCIISGKNIKEGFEIALRIAEDFRLKPVTIYNECGKLLAQNERYMDIAELVSCIKKRDKNSHLVVDMCDEMLTLAVATLKKTNVSGADVDNLIKLIDDKSSKISAYIEAKQLKTAYFLAVKYKRTSDIRRILREAEILNQPSIKTLCIKFLQNC